MPAGRRHAPKHRRRGQGTRRRLPLGAIVGIVVVVVFGTAAGAVGPQLRHMLCVGDRIALSVVASPDQSALLARLAQGFEEGKPRAFGKCVMVRVHAKDSAAVASALTPSWNSDRDGPRPDVWVPQSSVWARLASTRPETAPMLYGEQTVLARSPVVIVMPQPMAKALGWPDKQPDWHDLIDRTQDASGWGAIDHEEWGRVRVGMTDPSRSTAGLAALVGLADTDRDGKITPDEAEGLLALQHGITRFEPRTEDLVSGVDRADRDGGGMRYVSAFPAEERLVAQYNAGHPRTPLAAVYPSEDVPDADYPYVVLDAPWVNDEKRAAAALFRTYLRSPRGQRAFEKAGFRPADGGALAPSAKSEGVLPKQAVRPRPAPGDPVQLALSVATWNALRRPVNALVVIDVSGSMNQLVPTAGETKLQLVQKAAGDALRLFGGHSQLGLWQFSTLLDGDTDYQELVPLGPVGGKAGSVPRPQALTDAVNGLRAHGDTALYDTTLAAYQRMQEAWQPDRLNVVILLSDGRNEDSNGISKEELLDKLEKSSDPRKPVGIATIAYGQDADVDTLKKISEATGGRSFVAGDPKDLSRVFLTMLASSDFSSA